MYTANRRWNSSGSTPARATVRNYQWLLSTYGFLPDTPAARDGALGGATAAAITLYQVRHGLTPTTGTFGPRTVTSMDAELLSLASLGRRPPTEAEDAATRANAAVAGVAPPPANMGLSKSFVGGSQPTVAAITTAATATAPAQSVAVPPQVSQMLPPSTVSQLQGMPAPQVQSFINDLVRKVETAENVITSEGTGKDFTAVPLVAPDGSVVAAVASTPVVAPPTTIQPQGWWEKMSDGEKAGVAIGGVVVVGGLAGLLIWATRKK